MAGNSRDLTVNLVGKSDKLADGLDAGKSSTKFTAIGVTIGNLMSAGIQAGLQLAVQFASDAFSQFFDTQDVTANLEASLGLTPDVAAEFGAIAGDVYAAAWGDSMSEVGNTVAGIASSFGDVGIGDAGLETLTAQALALADVFGIDVTQAVGAAGILFKSGLVGDGEEAFDLLTRGMQEMPVSLRGELLDATSEYSQFFSALGIDGTEAFGLLVAASEDGQFGIDKTGDALKEFTIRATDGSALTSSAFEAMGLDMDGMSNRILAGGETARGAFDEIVAGLLSIEDPTEQANAAIALFGTPLEDLGTGEIPLFLEGLQSMDSELQNVDGAAQAAADTIGGTTRAQFEAFKRQAIDKLIEGTVKVVDFFKEFGIGGGIVRALGNLGGILMEKGKELLNGLWQGAQARWDDTALPWLKSLPGLARDVLGDVLGFLRQKGRDLLQGLWDGAKARFETIKVWVGDLPGLAVTAIGDALSFLRQKGRDLLQGLWDGAKARFETIKVWVGDLPGLAVSAIGDVLGFLRQKGSDLLQGLWDGAKARFETIKVWLGDIPGLAFTAISGALWRLWGAGWGLLQSLWDGISARWSGIVAWFFGLPSLIVRSIPNPLSALVGIGGDLASGLKSGFEAGIAGLIWIYENTLGRIPGFPSVSSSSKRKAGGGSKKFHDGGLVPGFRGQEVPALLEAGEFVIPADATFGFARGGSGGDTFHVTVNMPPGSDGDDVLRALQRVQRRRGPLPLRIAG